MYPWLVLQTGSNQIDWYCPEHLHGHKEAWRGPVQESPQPVAEPCGYPRAVPPTADSCRTRTRNRSTCRHCSDPARRVPPLRIWRFPACALRSLPASRGARHGTIRCFLRRFPHYGRHAAFLFLRLRQLEERQSSW